MIYKNDTDQKKYNQPTYNSSSQRQSAYRPDSMNNNKTVGTNQAIYSNNHNQSIGLPNNQAQFYNEKSTEKDENGIALSQQSDMTLRINNIKNQMDQIKQSQPQFVPFIKVKIINSSRIINHYIMRRFQVQKVQEFQARNKQNLNLRRGLGRIPKNKEAGDTKLKEQKICKLILKHIAEKQGILLEQGKALNINFPSRSRLNIKIVNLEVEAKIQRDLRMNLLDKNHELKDFYEHHIKQFIQIQKESDQEKQRLILELHERSEQVLEVESLKVAQIQQISLINDNLIREIEGLTNTIKGERQNYDLLEQEKDRQITLLTQEIEIMKANLNKIIEDSIRDRQTSDKYTEQIKVLDYQVHKQQKKIDRRDSKIKDLQKQLDDMSQTIQRDLDFISTLRKDNQSYQSLLNDIMRFCQKQNYSQIMPFLKELNKHNKKTYSFVEKIQKLMIQIKGGSKSLPPDVKEQWRWIRSLIEDLNEFKKNSNGNLDVYQTFDKTKSLGGENANKGSLQKDKSPSSIKKIYTPDSSGNNPDQFLIAHPYHSNTYNPHIQLSTGKPYLEQFDEDTHFALRQNQQKLQSQHALSNSSDSKNPQLSSNNQLNQFSNNPQTIGKINSKNGINSCPKIGGERAQQATENLRQENQYKDHVINLMRDYLQLDQNTGLLDIEFYLKNRLRQ
eukprot:403376967